MKPLLSLFLALLFVFSFPLSLFAQEKIEVEKTSTPSADVSIEYSFPYPGLLPDNPFYPLKAFRDRVIEFLISDPVKKAEFDFLQSDKRFIAGVTMIQNKKDTKVAITTISKGQNYFEEAINQVEFAEDQGKGTEDIEKNMLLSIRKQIETMEDLLAKVPSSNKKEFSNLLERAESFEKTLSSESSK